VRSEEEAVSRPERLRARVGFLGRAIGRVCGGLGAKPPNADMPAIFFPANVCHNVFLALFGPKLCNYYFNAFHNFHNYPYVQPK